MLSSSQPLIMDTPNVIFFMKHKEGQLKRNLIALTHLFITTKRKIIATLTPKMVKELGSYLDILANILEKHKGIFVITKSRDPDEVALELADNHNAPIITNDKFRQSKYSRFLSRKNTINFFVKNKKIFLIEGKSFENKMREVS